MKKETDMINDINLDEALEFVTQGVWTKDVFKAWFSEREREIFMSGVESGNKQDRRASDARDSFWRSIAGYK